MKQLKLQEMEGVSEPLKLLSFDQTRPVSITDRVYEVLYNRIINLDLPPGSKLSESEVSNQLGVSRQPVRDAFYRLSQTKLLMIRPQRATVVMPISEEAVYEAIFIRTALEQETVRSALPNMTPAHIKVLEENLKGQARTIKQDDRVGFHNLDEEFHFKICEYAGHDHVWTLIQNNKAHMDRIRYLSLETGAEAALAEHRLLLKAFTAGDEKRALAVMRTHINRIGNVSENIRELHAEYFEQVVP